MKYVLTIVPLLLFWSSGTFGQTPDSIYQIEKLIDSIAINQQQAFEVPGLAVGLIMNNEIVYAKGFGVQGVETQDPLTVQSLFHMASVSKPFVATAIMQLVEAGKLELDKQVVAYLPYFRMDDDRYIDITVRQMLNHSSGIPDVDDYEWDNPQYDDMAAERYVRSFKDDRLDFTPGEKFNYSNAAFDILADVIAKASGMTFEDYTKKYILEPVGMVNSTFFKPEVPDSLATQSHILNKNLEMAVSDIYPYNRIHAPSSTLHSNIQDMLLWAKMYLNGGSINNQQILEKESYHLILTPTIRTPWGEKVCLSWFSGTIEDSPIFSHSGGDLGYRTFFAFIPEAGLGIVVMGNNELFNSGRLANMIINRILLKNEIVFSSRPIHLHLRKYILTEGIEKFKEEYYREKNLNPKKYHFAGDYLDDLGYWLIDGAHYQQALDIFKFNVELEPDEAGWYDSVADAYRAMDNKEMAIEWYTKALAINPNQDFSRRKLEELKNE